MLYEVVVRATAYGQDVVNRFNYVSSGVPAAVSGSFGLASAMGFISDGGVFPADSIFTTWLSFVSNNVVFRAVEVRAAAEYDVEDFYEVPYTIGIPGEVTSSQGNSPLLAYGMRTNRVRLDIGRGYKRFCGVVESASDSGGIVASFMMTLLGTMGEYMSDVLTYDDEGNTLSYSPVVVSKLEYATPSGKTAYKYYPTLATQLEHVALGIQWSPYAEVRSQRSRQYGHGA